VAGYLIVPNSYQEKTLRDVYAPATYGDLGRVSYGSAGRHRGELLDAVVVAVTDIDVA
jgi:hypothetical protein